MTISSLQQRFPIDGKYTFLVGAGCSVDSPSCLPAGRQMMEAIIRHSCISSEVDKILALENLRYEQLMDIIRDWLDPDLKLFKFYELSENPNVQHIFLAEMLKKGNYVMTTNFDCLIEHALFRTGIGQDNIIPVITKSDFCKHSNPLNLFNNNLYGVYKIHGSTKNIITNEDTKESLVATIRAFGSGKEGESVFQLESFKRPLFENITMGRTLVVMGYSGSDDFDIVPTLKLLPEINEILWIDHEQEQKNTEIVQIDADSSYPKEDKVGKLLWEIQNMGYPGQIYRIIGNTSQIIQQIYSFKFEVDSIPFSESLEKWIENEVPSPDEYFSLHIPYDIYNKLGLESDAERCVRKILEVAEKNGNKTWKATALNNIGLLLTGQGKYNDAIILFKQALEIDKELGNSNKQSKRLNNIGTALSNKGDWSSASIHFKTALSIAELNNDLKGQAVRLSNLGVANSHLGNWKLAEEYHEKSLAIYEKSGDLPGRSTQLNNIGTLFFEMGNLEKSKSYLEEAITISNELGDLRGKATTLNNIGMYYRRTGKFDKAMDHYTKALEIANKLYNLKGKSTCLGNIGALHFENGKFDEALSFYKQSLEIDTEIGDMNGKARNLNNIGLVYREQNKNVETIKSFKEALNLYEKTKEQSGIATAYHNIGLFYDDRSNNDRAIENYRKAAEIDDKIGDLVHKALCLNKIGPILITKGDVEGASKCFDEALSIHQQMGNRLEIAKDLTNIAGIHYVRKNLKKSIEILQESLNSFQELEAGNSKEANDAREMLGMIKLLMKM
ncbi:MAG: tetratricopeptide repeat protein [Promethearchaeota archaeon]